MLERFGRISSHRIKLKRPFDAAYNQLKTNHRSRRHHSRHPRHANERHRCHANLYNVYFDDALNMPTSRIGLISGIGRLLGVPMSLTIPWLVARFGNFRLVLISLGLIITLMLPLALIPYWPIASFALISINSMGALSYLSFIAFTMALVSEKQRSLISGAGEMAIGTGFAISSLVGGYLIAWYGYRELFLFGAALTTLGLVAFWIVFRKRAAASSTIPNPAIH